jgi:UDP-2,4-diacetamido-2,4,6-trideoxy-beta-L-altropyranose hydrolase
MHLAIRTDASSQIGFGHLRRCISLAHGLQELGATVRFGVRQSDVKVADLLAHEGFACDVLPLPPLVELGSMTDELEDASAFSALASPHRPDWVIVDQYAIDSRWHQAVRSALGSRIAAIDDLANRPLAPDALIDHNYIAGAGHRERYAATLTKQPKLWLCGPRHALLGPAYIGRPPFEVQAQVRSVGIFVGATDPARINLVALRACRDVAGFTGPIEIATTSGNPQLAELQAAVDQDPHLSLSRDLPDLAGFYARHDLHIGAGGGATWERCCVGVPCLTLCTAENQGVVISELEAQGMLVTAPANDATNIGLALKPLLASHAQRLALASLGRTLVDGRGAERTALALAAALPDTLQLRDVDNTDARTLWHWRNDPATRQVSRQQDEIPYASHEAWLARTLAAGQSLLFIASIGTCELGVIRFDPQAGTSPLTFEVSLYLDPALHGLGLGTALLNRGEQTLRDRKGACRVHAEVLPENMASGRLFRAGGYHSDTPTTFYKDLVG